MFKLTGPTCTWQQMVMTSIPPPYILYQSCLNHADPLLYQPIAVSPVTCTPPMDQSDTIAWSIVNLDQSELYMSEWYSYSTLSSVEASFVIQFKWEWCQTELVASSTYNNHHLQQMPLRVVGPSPTPRELLFAVALICWCSDGTLYKQGAWP